MIHLSDLQLAFNRAVANTIDFKKWLYTFIALFLCGLVIVFFKGLALHATGWFVMSLIFFPVFLCVGLLHATGIFLIRVYYHQIKKREVIYRDLFLNSWDLLLGGSYISIPLILSYIVLWIALGIFLLLSSMPIIGEFFAAVFAFAPFLLNLAALLLCILSFLLLFYVAPIVALNGLDREKIWTMSRIKFSNDPFSNLAFGMIGFFPIVLTGIFLLGAAILTYLLCPECQSSSGKVLQSFFTMIPFAALLSPAVVFFFNFAAEGHVFIMKELSETSQESKE